VVLQRCDVVKAGIVQDLAHLGQGHVQLPEEGDLLQAQPVLPRPHPQ
jgi:hypothetical protein